MEVLVDVKVCNRCNKEKDLSEYYLDKRRGKLYNHCKECQQKGIKKSNEKNMDKARENSIKSSKKYHEKNALKIRKQKKEVYEKTKDIIIKKRNISYKTNLQFKLKTLFRSRVHIALKRQLGTKAYKTMSLIGCTIDEARDYIEQQFTGGMSWDNHGEWHIDHILPCASFDLTDPEEQNKCFHYTNLQPLWAMDNLIKGDRLDWVNDSTINQTNFKDN